MDILFDFETKFAGFYSNYFYFIHAGIICEKLNCDLYIKDDKWTFKYDKGLEDYYNINGLKKYKSNNKYIIYKHLDSPDINFSLEEYKNYISTIHILNDNVIKKYNEYCDLIKLPKEYNAIFIRLGDKLIHESKYYEVEKYINYLIKLNPTTKNLFIHSDDHNEVLKFIEYNKKNDLGFKIYNITTRYEKGALVIEHLRKEGGKKFDNIKSIQQYDNYEMKDHTEKMLSAIEILKNAKNIITDYQSNVSRFLKLYSKGNVHSILNDEPTMTDIYKNPGIGFIKV